MLTHSAFFAGVSAAGETAAAVLLLLPVTTRLGGAMAATVGLSYSISMDWVNLGYIVHNGSFALLRMLFLALGRLAAAEDKAVGSVGTRPALSCRIGARVSDGPPLGGRAARLALGRRSAGAPRPWNRSLRRR